MIAVLLEALKVVLAVKTELAMAAVVVKVSIRITAQKTFREHMAAYQTRATSRVSWSRQSTARSLNSPTQSHGGNM